uniref:Uncharacterized protein n=1 Tax=Oryza nivara TaxID=4536 RepID=A0A0E0GRE3_ORYNI
MARARRCQRGGAETRARRWGSRRTAGEHPEPGVASSPHRLDTPSRARLVATPQSVSRRRRLLAALADAAS